MLIDNIAVVGTPVQHKLIAHPADRMSPMIRKTATRAVYGRAHFAALIVFHNDVLDLQYVDSECSTEG